MNRSVTRSPRLRPAPWAALCFACWLGLALPITADRAVAQSWPSRTITAVVPFGPGTSIEAVGRPMLEQLSRLLGQPIVIENRPGAGGVTGAAAVARAEPDGHTILMFSSTLSILHAIHPNRPYDTLRDFIPVTTIGIQPNVLVSAAAKGYKSVADLVAAAKANPGAMNYASIGSGSAPHVAAERFRLAAGIEAQNVPFRGPPEALTETMMGRIDFYYVPLGSGLPLIRDGKLSALAVSTAQRATALPDIPTTIELGFKDSAFDLWLGILLPAKTPDAIVQRLYAETQRALDDPSVRQRFDALAVEQLRMTPAEFASYLAKDIEVITALTQKAGIRAN